MSIFLPSSRKFVDIEPATKHVGMSGEYKLIVRREDGSVSRETDWFPNIILDSGLNRWGTGSIILGAAIGTGNSTPVATQTGLDAQSAYTTTAGSGDAVVSAQASAPFFISITRVFRTALGALNGNFSEVGVGWASGANMFSRALILDAGQNPTTITVLSSEQLDIVYRLRIYPPAADTGPTVFNIGGTNYNVTGRAAVASTAAAGALGFAPGVVGWGTLGDITANGTRGFGGVNGSLYTGAIGIITALPSGTALSPGNEGSQAVDAYVNNSRQSVLRTTYGLAQGNLAGGFRSHVANFRLGSVQYDFGALVPKDATRTLVLSASITWSRRP